jgi:hypothetical protein
VKVIDFLHSIFTKTKRKTVYWLDVLQSIFTKTKRKDVIVSLTTIPSRLTGLEQCLKSLINQTITPGFIVLWLCEDNYFGKNSISKDTIPLHILEYERKGLLIIKWTKNIGPFTKLIPALSEFPDKKIITADDDTIYPKNWLKRLLVVSDDNPGDIVCYRGSKMLLSHDNKLQPYNTWPEFTSKKKSPLLFFKGKDGVLYPPGSFSKEIFNVTVFKKLTPFNDDIWYRAMALLNGTNAIKVESIHGDFPVTEDSFEIMLMQSNVEEEKNDEYLKKVFSRYDLFNKLH